VGGEAGFGKVIQRVQRGLSPPKEEGETAHGKKCLV